MMMNLKIMVIIKIESESIQFLAKNSSKLVSERPHLYLYKEWKDIDSVHSVILFGQEMYLRLNSKIETLLFLVKIHFNQRKDVVILQNTSAVQIKQKLFTAMNSAATSTI